MKPVAGAIYLLLFAAFALRSYDLHGRSGAPIEARRIRNPFASSVSAERLDAGKALYGQLCTRCHGEDGRARTMTALSMRVRPADLGHYLMDSMRDGEIYWVIGNGLQDRMPGFADLSGDRRWELVLWVRDLRRRQREIERAQLGPYEWKLPPGFPYPRVPAGNLMTKEKVELGRYLFYDKRLSLNRTQSCGTCHRQELAFTDGRALALGSTGEQHPRGAMSLVNVAYSATLAWSNPNLRQLEEQALVPIFGEKPVEMGMSGKEALLIERLKKEPLYVSMFPAAFPGEIDPFTIQDIVKAIACFERTILSGDSSYDRYRSGDDPEAISGPAKRGEALFFGERLECYHCHGGFTFSGSVDYFGKNVPEVQFQNNGLYNMPGRISYPAGNPGLYEFTLRLEDVGRFKPPSLRNLTLTPPFMHDGSIDSLDAVINHYAAGGRTITAGPRAGEGSRNPNKSEFLRSFSLTTQEREDVLAFLRSLTDAQILNSTRFSDPWLRARKRAIPTANGSAPILRGKVVNVYAEDGTIVLIHDAIPGFIDAARSDRPREFLVVDPTDLDFVRKGMQVIARVQRRGRDYILGHLR
jgi:cytochrome c peroxidase